MDPEAVHLEVLLSAAPDAEKAEEVLQQDWLKQQMLVAFLAWADTDRDKAAVGHTDFDWVGVQVVQEPEDRCPPLSTWEEPEVHQALDLLKLMWVAVE